MKLFSSIIEKYRDHPDFWETEITTPNQRGAGDDALLHIAASKGATDDIMALVHAGADIDMPGDLGNTPLHQAAISGKIESVRLLLNLNAGRDLKNEFGQTPLDVAILGRKEDIILILKKKLPTHTIYRNRKK